MSPVDSEKIVVEVSYSLDEGEDGWQRVAKVLVGLGGQVELYCESYKDVNKRK